MILDHDVAVDALESVPRTRGDDPQLIYML